MNIQITGQGYYIPKTIETAEEVSQKISEAELMCVNSGSVKNENNRIAAKELADMFGAWREGD